MIEQNTQAKVDELAALYGVSPVVYVASDNFASHLGFPAMAKLGNGNLIAVYRAGTNHSNPDSVGRIIFSLDGGNSWTGAYSFWTSGGNGDDIRDPNVSVLANGDVLVSFFVSPASGPSKLYWIKSSSNGAQGTFSAPTRMTFGHTLFENSSGPILERGSRWIWPFYAQNIGQAHSSAYLAYSDNSGSTWTQVLLADGITDGRDYTEPNVINVNVAAPSLSVGDVFALIRDDGGAMYECRVTGAGIVPGVLTNTGMVAHSAGRSLQCADGTILYLGRPNAQLVATLFNRLAPGSWTDVPSAPALDAYPGIMIYGSMLELSPGNLLILYSTQQGNYPNDHAIVTCRKWPLWQVKGREPGAVSPASVTLDVSTTQQFTAVGAAPFTWTISPNNTGGNINASTGLYTAGSIGGVTDTIVATDVNGVAVTVAHATTNSLPIETPDVTYGSALKQWLRGDLGTVSSWTDKSGNGNHATQATGGNQPTVVPNALNGQTIYSFASNAFMAHALNLTGPAAVFVVMRADEANVLGEAYTAGTGFPAIEASVNGSRHWGTYATGAQSSGAPLFVSGSGVWKICCVVYRNNGTNGCDLITDGSVVTVTAGDPNGGTKNNVGKDNGGLADPMAKSIAEIVAIQGSVTTTQLNKTVAYLQNRYGAI